MPAWSLLLLWEGEWRRRGETAGRAGKMLVEASEAVLLEGIGQKGGGVGAGLAGWTGLGQEQAGSEKG